jgi:hypothetical protein
MFLETSFGRLIWKEFRQNRAVWLAMLIGTPLVQAIILSFIWLDNGFRPPNESGSVVFGCGVAAVIAFLTACAATIFSVEVESGAIGFQRILPGSQQQVFWSKLVFVLLSTVALGLLIVPESWALYDFLANAGLTLRAKPYDFSTWFYDVGITLMIPAELLLWGICCSLLIPLPIWSVIAAALTEAFVISFVMPLLHGYAIYSESQHARIQMEHEHFVLARLVLMSLLAAFDVYLGKLWWEDRLRLPKWNFSLLPETVSAYPSNAVLPPYTGTRAAGWRRLIWLAWRDGRLLFAVLAMVIGALAIRASQSKSRDFIVFITITAYFGGALVCGLAVFGFEQQKDRYGYVTERGVHPWVVWLSRQLVFAPFALALSVPCYFTMVEPERYLAFCFIPAVYSAGQCAGMLVRRSALALAVAFLAAFLVSIWIAIAIQLELPFWLAVGVPVALMFWITFARCRDWIEQQHGWPARRRQLAAILVPGFVYLVTCATYRVLQIPRVTLPADWEALLATTPPQWDPNGNYTNALPSKYARELSEFIAVGQVHSDWTADQIAKQRTELLRTLWPKVADEFAPWAREPLRDVPHDVSLNFEFNVANINLGMAPSKGDLERLRQYWPGIVAEAKAAEIELSAEPTMQDAKWFNLEIAYEVFRQDAVGRVYAGVPRIRAYEQNPTWFQTIQAWAREPEQTSARLRFAMHRLKTLQTQADIPRLVALEELRKGQSYANFVSTFASDPSLKVNEFRQLRSEYWFANLLPWEVWREQRRVRHEAAFALQWCDAATHLVATSAATGSQELAALEEAATHRHFSQFAVFLLFKQKWDERNNLFAAHRVFLALLDHRMQHGKFPMQLSDLVPNYFERLPVGSFKEPEVGFKDIDYTYIPNGSQQIVTDWVQQIQVKAGEPLLLAGRKYEIDVYARLPDEVSLSTISTSVRLIPLNAPEPLETPSSEPGNLPPQPNEEPKPPNPE